MTDPVLKDLDNEMLRQAKAEAAEEAFYSQVNDERHRLLFTPEGMEELLVETDILSFAKDLATLCAASAKESRVVMEVAAKNIRERLDREALKLAEHKANNPVLPSLEVPTFLKSPRSA